MMHSFALLLLAATCAFAIGLAVNSGSTCAVTAARDLVYQRRLGAMVGFVLAIAVAGLVTLPVKWSFGNAVHFAGDPMIGWPLIGGAVLLGLGAALNGACLFGTLGRIGNGELRYFGMPLGLAIGFLIASHIDGFVPGQLGESYFAHYTALSSLILLIFLGAAVAAWALLGKAKNLPSPRYRFAMLLLGFAGAIEFMLFPGATYADAVRISVVGGMGDYAVPAAATLAALTGSIVSGISTGKFLLRFPHAKGFARSVGGGLLMAAGGWLVPGGNDALLLSYLPAATLGGCVAYIVMTATVIAILQTGARARRFT
jgi:uncharacterized protein